MRLDGWEDRLLSLIFAETAARYEPGRHDCFCFAIGAVEAITGDRPYADVQYTTDAGAMRVLRKRGFRRLGDAMAAVLPERLRGTQQRGDIAVIEADTAAQDTLGIVMPDAILVRVGHVIERHPLSAARMFLAVD